MTSNPEKVVQKPTSESFSEFYSIQNIRLSFILFLRVRPYSYPIDSSSFFPEAGSIQRSKGKIQVHGTDIEEPNSCNMYFPDFEDQRHLAFSFVLLVQINYYDLIPFD